MSVSRSLLSFKSFWLDDSGLSAFLLLLFVSLFMAPFIDSLLLQVISSLFFSLLMISGAMSISSKRLPRLVVGAVALSAIILRWADKFNDSRLLAISSSVATLLFLVLLTLVMLRRVFASDGRVTAHRIQGAVAVYVLIGLTWSILYQLCDLTLGVDAFTMAGTHHNDPMSRQEQFTYFSFVTLTTVGYGDITALHPIARMFVIFEALFGQLYPATLLARLVSLEVMHRQELEP
jgi:hypothetical protein